MCLVGILVATIHLVLLAVPSHELRRQFRWTSTNDVRELPQEKHWTLTTNNGWCDSGRTMDHRRVRIPDFSKDGSEIGRL